MKILFLLFIIVLCVILNVNFKIKEPFNNKNTIIIGSEGNGVPYAKIPMEYFIKLAYPVITIIYENNDNADLIIYSQYLNHEQLYNKKQKPYILWNGESYFKDHTKYYSKKCIINSVDGYKSDLKIPYCFFGYCEYVNKDLWLKHKYTIDINDRNKLFGYCISNRKGKHRNNFIEDFSNKNKNHYALGKYKHPNSIIDRVEGHWTNDNLVEKYSEFKFILAAENKYKKGYITEKIINVYSSGAIPIYMGDEEYAKKIFNPKSFICVGDFDSYGDCIDYIIQLSNDKNKLLQMYNEPIFTNNKESEIFRNINDRNASCNIEIANRIKDLFN